MTLFVNMQNDLICKNSWLVDAMSVHERSCGEKIFLGLGVGHGSANPHEQARMTNGVKLPLDSENYKKRAAWRLFDHSTGSWLAWLTAGKS
jgi:hypothetical protein